MPMKPDWDELLAPLLDLSRRCDEMFECLTPGRRWYDDVNERFRLLEVAIDWEIARLQAEQRSYLAYQRDIARERAKAARRLKHKRTTPLALEFAEE